MVIANVIYYLGIDYRMVYMSGSKAARHQAMIYNNTKIYGDMGGLVPLIGVPTSARSYLQLAGNTRQVIPPSPSAGLQYMIDNQLLSVNPQCSGGVGRKALYMCFN